MSTRAALYLAAVLGFGLVSSGAYVLGYRNAPRTRAVVVAIDAIETKKSVAIPVSQKNEGERGDCRGLSSEPKRHRGGRPLRSKLLGHWSSNEEQALYISAPDDLIRYDRQAKAPRYTWGEPVSGLQFDRNGQVREYRNMGCSDESDPVFDHSETWTLANGELVIEGSRRRVRAAVEVLDRRHLDLRVLEVCDYDR